MNNPKQKTISKWASMVELNIAEIGEVQRACHAAAVDAGWWSDLKTGEFQDRNDGELLALIHSEISEALEGVRKGLMDRHLPHRPMVEVELADALIRIFDMAEARGLDLGAALAEKLQYNSERADHKIENRAAPGGKRF